jgi:formate hydrogenlyase transcriptional activator
MPIPFQGTPSGLAFTSRQTLLIHRLVYEDFPSPLIKRALADGIKSGCSVPLISHNRVVGTITVGAAEERAYSESDAALLSQVGQQLSMPIENALNFREAKEARDRNRLLLEVGQAVVSNLTLTDLFRTVSTGLRRFINHDVASVVLRDQESGQLRVHMLDRAPKGTLDEGMVMPIEGTPAGLCITTRKTIRRDRIDFEEFHVPLMRMAYAAGLRCGCSVPLISHDQVWGALNVGAFREAAFTEADEKLLEQIAGPVAVAVENALNFQRAERERVRAQTLLEINNAITAHLDLRELIRATSSCLRNYFNHDEAALALYDESKKQLVVHAMDRKSESQFAKEGTVLPLEGTPVAEAFTTGRTVVTAHIDFEQYPAPDAKAAFADGIRSGCNVPLIARDRTLGVLGLASHRENAFSDADANLLQSIAGQVALAVENSLQFREIESLKNMLASEKHYLEEEIKTQYNFAEIVGRSKALQEVLGHVQTVAPTDSTVLLCGETGTGKELIARAIHNLSGRKERTLVKLNCAAIPTGLLESELFGHEKGAFTGAIAQRVGRFELANHGTLLLDEIGEIPLDLQSKLLRVLQEHEFERLGSSRTIRTDVRLIAATNCDLAQMVSEKKFRSDLFYRLNVFPITIPPLRLRVGDIDLLAGYFTQKHSARMNKQIKSIPSQTLETLCNYHWPGNVRELENFIERSVILSSGSDLQAPLAELRPMALAASAAGDGHASSGRQKLNTMDEMERSYIEEVLLHANGAVGGKGGAAEILGMPSSTLRSRMKKLGIK